MTDEELKRLLEENAAETREHFDGAVERIEARFDDAAARQAEESRRHFVATAERIEKRFDTLAETVEHLDQRLAREAADVRDEMRRGFAETQAMIKFSHVELDLRVRTLEATIADHEARLERLESGTH